MPDDSPSTSVELDAECWRLELESAKAKYLEQIASAKQGAGGATIATRQRLVPSTSDAPKGEVTLGAGGGALGPWRAHAILDGAAERIATDVKKALRSFENARVLVVDDRALLRDSCITDQVTSTLGRLSAPMQPLTGRLTEAQTSLDTSVTAYRQLEARREPASTEAGSGHRRSVTVDDAKTAVASDGKAAPEGSTGTFGAAISLAAR
jgi:hypothetical protein